MEVQVIIKHPGEKNELWSPSNGWLKVVEEEFSSDLTKLRTVTVLMKNGEYKDFYGDGREFIDAPAPALFAEIPEFYKQFLPKEKTKVTFYRHYYLDDEGYPFIDQTHLSWDALPRINKRLFKFLKTEVLEEFEVDL